MCIQLDFQVVEQITQETVSSLTLAFGSSLVIFGQHSQHFPNIFGNFKNTKFNVTADKEILFFFFI